MNIPNIDQIARQKQRTVLFLTFMPEYGYGEQRLRNRNSYDWRIDSDRIQITEWLTFNNIPWYPCRGLANDINIQLYRGEIYLDILYDEFDDTYQMVRNYLEYADGSMRFEHAVFWYLKIETAMRNKHHDVPGYWERWHDG